MTRTSSVLGSTTEWFAIPVIMVCCVRPVIALPSRFAAVAATWPVPVTAIGVTYQDAIVRAGGQPVALAPIAGTISDLTETLSRFDGLCLPGGPDVDPHLYGADEIHPAVYGVDERHDAFDLALAKAAIELRMPILAICRGHQVLNVALGGTLIQHLGDERTPTIVSGATRWSCSPAAGRRWRWAPTGQSGTPCTTRPSTGWPTAWS